MVGGGGVLCLQAGVEDDGEEVYLPPGMGLVCVLAGGCIFPPQACVCVYVVQVCTGQCLGGCCTRRQCEEGCVHWQGYGFDPRVCAGRCWWACKHVSVCVCGKRSLGCLCPQ